MFRQAAIFVLQWWMKVWGKLFFLFQHLTGKSSWAFTWFLWVLVVILNLWYDMTKFDPTDWFMNLMNIVGYGIIIWLQLNYNKSVKNNNMTQDSDMFSYQIIISQWLPWHIAMILWYSLFIGFAFFSLFFFVRIVTEILWHVSCTIYVSGGKKTIWAKMGEKAKSLLEAKTPNLAPMPA